ncbi:MAG: hypothetical protein AUK32_04650 [Candidatus Aquicultor secundus]|nr:MAG: hypothetical protein AUK32_04650 [Candidatus Aquicultor secundus]
MFVKKKVIIAVIVLVAIGGLIYARSRAIDYYSLQTAIAEAKGDFPRAINSFDKVVLLSPRDAAAFVYRARLYFNNGNTNAAIDDLNTAINIDKKNPEAHFGISLIRLQEGDLKQAVKELDLVIKERPKWIEAYLSREVAYRKLGDKDKAIKDLKQVLKLEPQNPAALNSLRALE